MFGIRTPATRKAKTAEESLDVGQAGPSVRRSIGEWEAERCKPVQPLKTPSPSNKAPLNTPPKLKSKSRTSQEPKTSRAEQQGESNMTLTSEVPPVKYLSRTTEAKACLMKAKMQLASSRNLKKEIKDEILKAVERLYELVKEAESKKLKETEDENDRREQRPTSDVPTGLVKDLIENLHQHKQALAECQHHTRSLSEQLTKEIPRFIAGQGPTFAEMAAVPRPQTHKPLHSVVVSSIDEFDTSEGVIGKLRMAVDAKTEGTRVERLRKARDQKVILGFNSREEMTAVKERIRKSGGLRVEEVQNKDPLIILKDVLSCHADDEVVHYLKVQNAHLLGDVAAAELRMAVKYRRRTRNPHMGHIVLQVSPQVWQRLTVAGRVHVDLQRLRVADQSPLVQCSICLGYGHSRKHCQDTEPLCSHCGDPHLRSDCPAHAAGAAPVCRNCQVAKGSKSDHSAFSSDCPMRLKWDSLARSSVAYC